VVAATTSDLHFEWDVAYQPGVLRAVGKERSGKGACHDEVRTAGMPVAVRLVADRDTVTNGSGDVALVRYDIVDSAGVVVPGADNVVHVTVTGGTLTAMDNADMRYHGRYQVDSLPVLNGRGLAIIKPIGPTLTVTATAGTLKTGQLSIPVHLVLPAPAVPSAR
jgi:beta-galactosidase